MSFSIDAETDAVLSRSWELILESRNRLVRVGHSLRGLRRQSLRLSRGGTAGEGATVRARVRSALAAGTLPRVDGERTWAGRGRGATCRVCARPIDAPAIEHEVELAEVTVVHRDCYFIWRDESARLDARGGTLLLD